MAERADKQPRFMVARTCPDGTVRWRPALSRRTRIRLAVTKRVDKVCCWLCGHGHDGTAVLIWRACGMW